MNTSDHEFQITDPAEMLVDDCAPLAMHPGVYFRTVVMPQWKLNVSQLAERIGVNRPNLHNVLQGKSEVSRELAYRIGALLGDSAADFLIAAQHRWNLEQEREHREALKAGIARMDPPA